MGLLGLRRECYSEERLEWQSFAKRRSKIRLLGPEETCTKPAISREPHSVAAAAVGMRHGRDNADSAHGAVKPKVARRAIPSCWTDRRLNGRNGLHLVQNLVARHHVIPCELAHFSNGHQLDEPHVPIVLKSEPRKIADFVVVYS